MSSAERSGPAARHVAAVAVGNALEFYDFLTYAFFAAQIGRAFFPSSDPTTSLLASLATFGAGFLMRPVGGIVIGRIGDRVGRRPAMVLSFTLMGLAMLVLALTPSYAAIGVAAPVVVILARLVQGFALGGEVGPSTAFMVEAAPPEKRGLYVSLQFVTQHAAVLASGLVGMALTAALSEGAVDAWGWRAAFLLGALIVPFGFVLRRSLPETLHETPELAQEPKTDARVWPIVVLGLLMLTGGTIVTYVLNYLKTYASETLHLSGMLGFGAIVATGLTGVLISPLGGALSDKYGRKPVMVIPWSFLLIIAIPAFSLVVRERNGPALIGVAIVLQFLAALITPPVLTAIGEGLPRRIRAGSLGLTYAVAISVFGGTTQFNVAWLTKVTGSPLSPAWYMTGGVAVGLIAMLLMPETAPARRTR
ncbi:MAG: MFS transporter [Parcubacteria group bacterium]